MSDEKDSNSAMMVDQRRFPTGERYERIAKLKRGPSAVYKLKLGELRENTGDCLNTFLYVLSRTGRIVDAINAINADERAVFTLRTEDEDFRDAWRQAQELYNAALEDEVQRRAVEGVERAILYKGEVVGMERIYSDTLLIALLRRRSLEWKEALSSGSTTNVDVNVGQTLQTGPGAHGAPALDTDAMRRRIAALSPAERTVALKLFGMDDTLLDVPSTEHPPRSTQPTHQPALVQVADHAAPHHTTPGDPPDET